MSMRLGPRQGFPGGRVVESPPAKAGDAGGWGSITGQEDPPEETDEEEQRKQGRRHLLPFFYFFF